MPLEANRHLDDEEIEQYSRGEGAKLELSRLEEHLLICESCQNRVTETDHYVIGMQAASRRIRHEAAEKERRNIFLLSRLIPVFAAVALLVFIAVLGMRGSLGGPRTTVAVNLVATRGNSLPPRAPEGSPLKMHLDLSGTSSEGPVRLELVDRLGSVAWQGSAVPQAARAVAAVPGLSSGLYFLRAYASSGTLLREYGFEIVPR